MAYNHTAKGLSALGRKGDDTLLHVSKSELAGLQSILGPISTNPNTGLPEAFAWKDLLAAAGIGIAGALTGGAALAAAPEIGALGATAVGSGIGALGGGAITAAEGKGFGSGALGGAISGGLGGYGGAGSFDAAGAGLDSAGKAGLGKPLELSMPTPTPSMSLASTGADSLTGQTKYLGGMSPVAKSLDPLTGASHFAGPQNGGLPSFTDTLGDKTSAFFNKGLPQQAGAMSTKAGMESLLYPIGAGTAMGTAATGMIQQNAANAELAKQQQAQTDANAQDQQDYFASLGYTLPPLSALNNPSSASQRDYIQNIINPRGAAAGGAMTVQMPMDGTQVSATLPPKYVAEYEKTDPQVELNKVASTVGMADGGYVNSQPMLASNTYPQALIPNAQPFAASTPQRHEVIHSFENGGMLDGPGDGMSDDIPANIDGEEEIRLADGEFVVPPDLVRILGFGDPEKGAKLLDNLLPIVRQASHGKKTQIKQDAGKLAVEKMMTRAAKGKKA